MTDAAISPIRRGVSLAQEVAERLSRAIVAGDFAEGAPLPEAQTAVRLGVSRVPVREELADLERRGLVDFDVHGRARVKSFSEEDVREILSLRAALQAMAAGLAASKLTPGDVDRLDDLLARAARTRDLTKFSALDSAFHDEIVAIARHRRLARAWTDLRSQMDLWLARLHRRRESATHDVRPVTLASHREIVEVLKSRRPEAAARRLEKHCAWEPLP